MHVIMSILVLITNISLSLLYVEAVCLGLLKNMYKVNCVNFKCPQCNMHGECTQKTEIRKLPPVLFLHKNVLTQQGK